MPASTDPNRTCKNCPSFLEAVDTPSKFKKSIGSPMCGRYGTVLGKPGLKPGQEEKIQKAAAINCDAYGEPLPPTPVRNDHLVVLPDLDARVETDASDPKVANCQTCATCRNYVSDGAVVNDLGWAAGLCAAKGKLLMPTRLVYEARNCEYRYFGPVRQTTLGLNLLPEFEDAFNLNVNPVNAYFKSTKNFVEPHEWPTDKPVDDEDKAHGIRAWRVIKDPEGTGNEVYLPVYDLEFFDVDERAKIPRSGDDEHPELYIDHNGAVYKCAVLWTELDETPALWGSAGTGKTELYRHLAWLMCLPFERMSITGETEIDELAGTTAYTPEKGTFFQYGRLPKAWAKPSVICIDEPNVGPPEVWQFIRPLTDNSKQLVLDMNEGERIERHTDCFMGMAMNPAWDPKNVGAAVISDADARRLMHVYMELPPAILEREIIKNRIKLDGWEIDDARLDTIMSIAEDIRGLCNDQTLPITWGVAQQIKVARATRWFDMLTAYRMAGGDFLEPQAQEAMLDQVKAHVES
jgi:MoxR-like ATPase